MKPIHLYWATYVLEAVNTQIYLFSLFLTLSDSLNMACTIQLDLDFLGIVVPKVGFLNTKEPKKLLDECHKTKLLGIIGWDVIKLAYQVF